MTRSQVGWVEQKVIPSCIRCAKERGDNSPTRELLTKQTDVGTFCHFSEKRGVVLKVTLHSSWMVLYAREVCASVTTALSKYSKLGNYNPQKCVSHCCGGKEVREKGAERFGVWGELLPDPKMASTFILMWQKGFKACKPAGASFIKPLIPSMLAGSS